MATRKVGTTYLSVNVFDAARQRIRWLFREFPVVVANFSGGKDSTIIVNLALQVAEEEGRLPLPVLFVDQEAEWDATIDYARQVMHDPRVDARWLQVPFRLFNASSLMEPWAHCWQEGETWLREKEPDSIHVNEFGTDRFTALLNGYVTTTWKGQRTAQLTGVRAEESPSRRAGVTNYETYKGETWGAFIDSKKSGHFRFHPLYDWSYRDVWKAIHDHGWPYNRLYDLMYQYGIPPRNMRVSNVHHETALTSLFFMQAVEPDTWNRITDRLMGINSVGHLRDQWLKVPSTLPPMFKDWWDYRDHLLVNLVPDREIQDTLRHQFSLADAQYTEEAQENLCKLEIGCILRMDWHGTRLSVFSASHGQHRKGRGRNRDRFTW